MKLRHQLAAYSPVTLLSIANSVSATARMRRSAPTELGERLRERYRADKAILYGSGTQALQCAIAALMPKSQHEGFVALPAFNCYDMASAAIGTGARVALYDVNPDTLAPDLHSFERLLAGGASVAVLACLYGVPFDWGAYAAIAARYGVPLIEDAAQGHGASWNGTRVGALGDVSIVSFGRGKGWTGGNGGAVLVRGHPASQAMRSHGASANARLTIGLAAQWLLGRPSLYGLPRALPSLALGETVYHPPVQLASMTEAAAAAALSNEAPSDVEAQRRVASGVRYLAALAGTRAITITTPSGAKAGYIRFPVRLPDGLRSLPARAGELGVAPSYPVPLSELSALEDRLVAVQPSFPGADRLAKELVTLPSHSLVRPAEQKEIIEMLRRI